MTWLASDSSPYRRPLRSPLPFAVLLLALLIAHCGARRSRGGTSSPQSEPSSATAEPSGLSPTAGIDPLPPAS